MLLLRLLLLIRSEEEKEEEEEENEEKNEEKENLHAEAEEDALRLFSLVPLLRLRRNNAEYLDKIMRSNK